MGSAMRALVAVLSLGAVSSFLAPRPRACMARSPAVTQRNALPVALIEAGESYAAIWTPLFKSAIDDGLVPDFLLHWGHGAAMSTVLLSMGVIGTWMGWEIRGGNGSDANALTLGDTIRETHPKIMAGAFFFFVLGGQGGLILNIVQGNAALESAHAQTGVAALSLLAVEAALPALFDKGKALRDAHAYLGSAIMVLLFAHMAAGFQLGFSF